MTPAELDIVVGAAQQGDAAAFEQVVRATHRELRIFLAVRTSSPELVEEAVQAALVTAWEKLETYQRRGTFLPWLKGIGLRMLRRELAARQRGRGGDTIDQLLAGDDLAELEDETHALAQRRLDGLRRCLQGLDRAARELLQDRYVEGRSLGAIARRVGRSTTAVGSTLHRIRKRLRLCLERTAESS